MALSRTTVLAGLMLAATASAQSTLQVFDVASIKPYRLGGNDSAIIRDGGRMTLRHVSLRECIMFAYSIPDGREYELVAPNWMSSERFDIEATFPPATPYDRVRQMVQSLLSERFSLKVHRETKRVKAYELKVVKGGANLKTAERDVEGAFIHEEGHVTVRGFSLDAFADRLSGPAFKLDRPVVNKTGIKGAFSFSLEWTPLEQLGPGPTLFTALQEQLGLRLNASQTDVRVLVVDSASRTPTGN